MACILQHKKSKDNMKQFLTDLSVMDNFDNILDYPKFIKVNNQLRQNTEDVYKIIGMGNPFLVSDIDETKAIPNEKLFEKIDDRRKQLGLYEDRIAGNKGNSTIIGEVNYKLRALEILQSDKGNQVFEKGAKNGWPLEKILTELAIPKDQKDIILGLGIKNRDQIIIELATQYSFAVKIDTALETPFERHVDLGDGNYDVVPNEDEFDEDIDVEEDEFGNRSIKRTVKLVKKAETRPTRHYANLNVPGGINYTENEISTPLIVPAIIGHAAFSTNSGIGWFRSDDKTNNKLEEAKNLDKDFLNNLSQAERDIIGDKDYSNITKEPTKTRRIIEVQSDLFQKGRLKEDLILSQNEDNVYNAKKEDSTREEFWIAKEKGKQVSLYNNTFYEYNGYYYDFLSFSDKYYKIEKNSKIDTSENQFLQLLNKDNNWVTFFIKSIIQDSAKKGYEKVLFPLGDTASKVEGHETLEEFVKSKQKRIEELENMKRGEYFYESHNGIKYFDTKEEAEKHTIMYGLNPDIVTLNPNFTQTNTELEQLKQEIESAKQDFGKLRTIWKFYEETVANILKKNYKEGLKKVTDEYGNDWMELTVDPDRDTKDVFLQLGSSSLDTIVTPELRDTLVAFAKKLNPNFKIEILDNLLNSSGDQVDGIAKINEFLIQLRNGKEGALAEEVSHFFYELLPNDHPIKVKMNDEITRTRIYKQVMNDYRDVYKGDPQKLKNEAAAKLISLYLTDPKLFKHWSGSDSLIENISRIIRDFIQWLKGKGKSFSSFIDAANDIVNLDTSKLNVDLAEDKSDMYAISDWNKFQSLNNKSMAKYDRVLFNINDTLLDYKNYPGTAKEKRDMLFGKPLERDQYFNSSKLTVLGRELKDKIEMGLLDADKIMVYTQMTVTAALTNRLAKEFGIKPGNIIQVNETEFFENEDGNPIEVPGESFMDTIRGIKNTADKILVVDNAVINTEGLTDIQPYRNKKAEYTSPQRLFQIQEEKKNKKELTTRVLREFNQILGVDKKTLTERMLEAGQIVNKQLSRIEYVEGLIKNEENEGEIDKLFRDSSGLLSLPKDRALAVKNLIENTKDYERAALEFVSMIEATTAFFKERNDSGYQSVKDAIEKGDKTALQELNLVVQMGKRWQEYTAQFYKFLVDYPGTNEVSGLMGRLNNEITKSRNIATQLSQEAIQGELAPMFDAYNEIKQGHIDDKIKLREEAKLANDEGLMSKLDEKIELLKAGLLTSDTIVKALNGEIDDIPSITVWVKALYNSSDMLTGGVAKLIKRSELEVDTQSVQTAQAFGEKVENIKKESGVNQKDIEDNLIVTERVRVWNNDTGAHEYKEANALLNPWINREDYYIQREPLDQARLLWQQAKRSDQDENEVEQLFQKFLEQKKIFENWRHENWYDEYVDDFYERYNRLKETPRDVEIYEKAITLQNGLWSQVSSLREQLEYETENDTIDDLNKKIQDTVREAKNLRSNIDLLGNNKSGEELEIAQMLQRKLEIDKEVYEYKSDVNKFKKDFKTLVNSINSLILRDDIKQTLLFKLEEADTDFTDLLAYAKQEATEEIIDWLDRFTVNRYSDTFYKNRKEIVDRLSDLGSELSTIYGEDSTPIKEIWEKLFNETSYLRDEDGIFDGSVSTTQTQKTVKDYEKEIERLKNLASLDRVELYDQLDDSQRSRVAVIKRDIAAAIEALQEIQSKQVTDSYIETFITKANETGFLNQFNNNPKNRIALGYGSNMVELINSVGFKEFRVNNPDHEFIKWFDDNHFVKEVFIDREKVPRFTPTYIWYKIEPTNGSDILNVPSWKYSSRSVKPEFKTTKDNWKTWNPVKGNWLPKSPKYINPAYQALMSKSDQKSKGLQNILRASTDFHLMHQEDAPREAKLEFVLPYIEKKELEGNIFKSMYNQFIDKNNRFEQGEGNFDETGDKKGWDKTKAKLAMWYNGFVNNSPNTKETKERMFERVAVPYSKYVSPEEATKDIILSMTMFAGTTAKAKKYKDLLPLINLIKENLADQSTKYTKTGEVKRPNANRLAAIEHIEDTRIYGKNKAYELGVQADRAVTMIRKVNTLGSLSDVTGVFNNIKNNFQGRLQNFINSEFSDWSSPTSMRKASTNMQTNLFKYLNETEKALDKRSKDYHIITYFLPTLSGDFRQMLLKGAPKNLVTNQMGFLMSHMSEFGISTTSLYGHLYHVKVEKEGQVKTLYDILKVTDGHLDVESGWKIKGRNKEVDMNYLLDTNTTFISVQEYMQGKTFDKTKLSTYTIGQAVLYFKNWLIPMLRRRFDKNRPNYVLNEDVEGYWRTFARLSFKMGESFFKEGKAYWSVYTDEEKRNYIATCKEIGVMFASLMILSLVFGFDADDPDKFKKLKDNSYLENVALLIALQTKNETESLSAMPFLNIEQGFVPPILTEGAKFKDKPFIGMAIIDDTWKLFNATYDLAMGSPTAYYDKNIPQFNIDKGDTKAGHYFLKMSQLDDLINLKNPAGKIQQVIGNMKR